jgi:MoaA/NifB/PqqE/SkfB family radical SAM enzyme
MEEQVNPETGFVPPVGNKSRFSVPGIVTNLRPNGVFEVTRSFLNSPDRPVRLLLAREEENSVVILSRLSGSKHRFSIDDPMIAELRRTGRVSPAISPQLNVEPGIKVHWLEPASQHSTMCASPFPLRIYLGLNTDCNLRCKMCYVGTLISQKPVSLRREHWMPILTTMEEHGLVEIRLGESGEPTINPELLTEFLQDAKSFGFYISLTTNGQFEHSWIKHWINLVDEPIFSIDGDRDSHEWNRGPGTYDRVIRNMAAFSGRSQHLRVNTILSRRLLPTIDRLADICSQHRVNELCFLQMRPYDRAQAYWDELLRPDDWTLLLQKTIPELRKRYPETHFRPPYDVAVAGLSDRLVDKTMHCSAGVEALGLRPRMAGGRLFVRIYGCGYLAEEGSMFVAGELEPDVFPEAFPALWADEKCWQVFRESKQGEHCGTACGHFGTTCFGQCVAQQHLIEGHPGCQPLIKCPFFSEDNLENAV